MGGDDLWALLILAHMVETEKCNLLGIGSCFGNTNVEQATRNVLDTLALTRIPDTPVFEGSQGPISGLPPLLDGAYGSNGLSKAKLPPSSLQARTQRADRWMIDALRNAGQPITILCTGPLTDVAKALDAAPEIADMGHEVIWLGGALKPTGLHHQRIKLETGEFRNGNITLYAEFNAINDPVAAQIVADSGIKFTIMPLDATQHLVADHGNITSFLRGLQGKEAMAIQLLSMLDDAAKLDSEKFGVSGAFQHDGQIPVFMTNPELFLPTMPVVNLQFANEEELARNFNAQDMNFDFSKLGRHGEMTCAIDNGNTSHIRVIPGLYSFTDSPAAPPHEMQAMCDKRWDVLTHVINQGLK